PNRSRLRARCVARERLADTSLDSGDVRQVLAQRSASYFLAQEPTQDPPEVVVQGLELVRVLPLPALDVDPEIPPPDDHRRLEAHDAIALHHLLLIVTGALGEDEVHRYVSRGDHGDAGARADDHDLPTPLRPRQATRDEDCHVHCRRPLEDLEHPRAPPGWT